MRPLLAACVLTLGLTATGCKIGKGSQNPGPKGGVSISPVAYGPNANAPKEAVNKCHFELALPEAIEKEVGGAKQGGSGANTLSMTIVRVSGATPEWEGEHAVIVEGEYAPAEGETKKFRIKRSDFGGAFGGWPGVCAGLDKVAEQMAIDLATWLENPEDNNRL